MLFPDNILLLFLTVMLFGCAGQQLAPISSRTREEVQTTFNQSEAKFNAIFLTRPKLKAGNIVLSFTIESNGSVSAVQLVLSTFNDSALESEIIRQVKLLKFKAGASSAFFYTDYTIGYFPSTKTDSIIPLSTSRPILPAEICNGSIKADVTLKFIINIDGRVSNVQVLKSEPTAMFGNIAAKNVLTWVYARRKSPIILRQAIHFDQAGC